MNRLKIARKENGLTQAHVAQYIGLSQPSYSDWERGVTKIDSNSLSKLATLFNRSTDYLLGDTPADAISTVILVPVLGYIQAGIPIEAIEDIIDWEEIPAEWGKGGKEYFGLKVRGDSMYPDYLEGDTVILRKTPCCESGDICAVLVNGDEATLKEVKIFEDGRLQTIPRNSAYAPCTYTPEQIEGLPVAICGVVVELRRRVKK